MKSKNRLQLSINENISNYKTYQGQNPAFLQSQTRIKHEDQADNRMKELEREAYVQYLKQRIKYIDREIT